MPATCEGFCGLCYENAKGRSNHQGHYKGRKPGSNITKVKETKVKKPDSRTVIPAPLHDLDDSDMAKSYPCLFEMLTTDKWDTGEPRKTTTILLFMEEGLFKACVHDRALGLSGFMTGDSLAGLLMSVEVAIRSNTMGWKANKRNG